MDGSTPIFSASAGDKNSDLSVTLTVQTIDHSAGLVSSALAVNGSADTSGNLTSIGTGESVYGQNFQLLGVLNGTAAGPVQTTTFAAQNKLTLVKDISDKTSSAMPGTGMTTCTSEARVGGQVPEPASIVLLLTGVASLGVLSLPPRTLSAISNSLPCSGRSTVRYN